MSNSHTPLLSVIVPVYNVEPWLRRCLESICSQSYRHLEIICVDDGSTDGSLAILREFEAKDDRVRVVTKPNGGQAQARNVALDMARGEWVTGVDSDDYMQPGAYSKAMGSATDEVDMVVFGMRVEAAPGSGLEQEAASTSKWANFRYSGPRKLDAACLSRFGWYFVNKLYRRELIEQEGLRFDPANVGCEDMCFFMRYSACVRQAYFCPARLYTYALRRGSTMYSVEHAERRPQSFLNALENVASIYQQRGLLEPYAPLFAYLFSEVSAPISRWSLLAGQPFLWRRRLLQLGVRFRLHELPASAPVLHELAEQLRCAQMVMAQLKACVPPAPPSVPELPAALHVAIPADDACAAQALRLAEGLLRFAADDSLCIHFICDAVSAHARACMEHLARPGASICVHEVDSRQLRCLPSLGGAMPRAPYLKMALPWLLPAVERVLVLSPSQVVTGALPPLASVEMQGLPVAVLPASSNQVPASVLLLNLAAMREQGGAESWVAACMFCKSCLPHAEADSLALAFQGRMASLPADLLSVMKPAPLVDAAFSTEEGAAAPPLDAARLRAWECREFSGRRVEDLAPMYRRLRLGYYVYTLLAKLPLGKKKAMYAQRRRACRTALHELRRFFQETRQQWGL